MGHTCYVNSCVQALMFTPQFRAALSRTNAQLSSLVYQQMQPQQSSFDHYTIFVQEFSSLLNALDIKKQCSPHAMLAQSVRPTKYLNALSNIDERYGALSDQQDVQEFFVFLLSTLDDGVKMTQTMIEDKTLVVSTHLDHFGAVDDDEGDNTQHTAPISGLLAATSDSQDKEAPTSNPKKRDHSALSIGTSSSVDLPMCSSVQLDSLGSEDSLEAPAKRPKLFEETSLMDVTAASTQQSHSDSSYLNHTILPGSQDLQRELELRYEMDSQLLPDDGNTMNVDCPPSGPEMSRETSSLDPNASILPHKDPSTSIHSFFPSKGDEIHKPAPQLHPHELFQGEITSTFECMECERESGRPEAFFDVSLAIEKDRDLHWSLSKFFAKSILGGSDKYECESCRHLNEAYSYMRLSRLPEVLTIHLKRFAWTAAQEHVSGYSLRGSLGGGSKLTFNIDCPEVLDISLGWLSSSLQQRLITHSTHASESTMESSSSTNLRTSDMLSTSSQSIRRSLLLHSPNAPAAQYELYAVLYHTGSSTTFGHYTCAVRIPSSESENDQSEERADRQIAPSWALFDDDHVRPLTHEHVMRSISSTSTSASTAYILFYRRLSQAREVTR